MKQALASVDLVTKQIRRFILGLDREGGPFSAYDDYYDCVVVVVSWNYKVPRQCPEKSPLVLFEEDHEDAGNKPITGFQIKNVSSICRKHGIIMASETFLISQILAAVATDNVGLCTETAVSMATELVRRHNLDKIRFPV